MKEIANVKAHYILTPLRTIYVSGWSSVQAAKATGSYQLLPFISLRSHGILFVPSVHPSFTLFLSFSLALSLSVSHCAIWICPSRCIGCNWSSLSDLSTPALIAYIAWICVLAAAELVSHQCHRHHHHHHRAATYKHQQQQRLLMSATSGATTFGGSIKTKKNTHKRRNAWFDNNHSWAKKKTQGNERKTNKCIMHMQADAIN